MVVAKKKARFFLVGGIRRVPQIMFDYLVIFPILELPAPIYFRQHIRPRAMDLMEVGIEVGINSIPWLNHATDLL